MEFAALTQEVKANLEDALMKRERDLQSQKIKNQ
jgi:hypothetical protein